MTDYGLDLAITGNGRTAALIEPGSRITWWCFPRFDSNPVFCRLLAGDEEKGFTDVVLADLAKVESDYLRNTPVVVTTLTDSKGNAVRITDFAPRFHNFDRIYRAPQMIRIIEPAAGLPRIAIRFRPAFNYGHPIHNHSLGSNHIRYWGAETQLRLSTDVPLSYVESESTFVVSRPLHMVFGADEPFPAALAPTCRDFLDRTIGYWREWVRRLNLSYDWQEAMIRSAITLKLSNFEETGGIIAAHTTSIPESPRTGRNWDYRYVWLRDAHFVVKALNRIGATQTMEDFIFYILNLVSEEKDSLRPVYGVVPSDPMDEWIADKLPGYRGDGPVRLGNAAAVQAQHDTYGSIILAAMPMFFDRRLPRMGDETLFRLLETLGHKAERYALTPDAGIWEYRGRQRVHTHSVAMCWAGCNRLAAIAETLGLRERCSYWNDVADRIHKAMMDQAWNEKRQAFTAAFGAEDLDAAVLLLPELGVVDAHDPRFVKTVAAMERELLRDKHMMRYASPDDFGMPEAAFLICRYWLIDAYWALGRREEARELFVDSLRYRNRYGLLSEDIHLQTGELWGNFPQTYSMAGMVLTAMRLSRSWEDRYWRG
jgi:GH15 family glucan-1,4-alpha-glucosidase